jgi:arylsulfatase A-like enzyme
MTPTPKHIIWITADHMRADCIGAWGNSEIHTPNLNRLADSGVNFRNCFAQNPLCMPSRASFMTGLYPPQTQVTSNGQPLEPNHPLTAPRLFKPAGYATAQIGKLHLSPHEESDLSPTPAPDYGFDVCWLSEEPGCYEDAYVRYLRSHWPQHESAMRLPRPIWPDRQDELLDRPIADVPWQASHSGFVACQADRYLAQHGRLKQFVHLGFYAPHPPLNPTREMFAPYAGRDIAPPQRCQAEWSDKPEPLADWLHRWESWSDEQFIEYRRRFYAMVTGLDMGVGLVLRRLEEMGDLDDTLIVFNSDHGDQCGDHGLLGKSPWFYDQTMRAGLMLHWPAGLGRSRRDVEGLVELVDLMPTLLELCGLPPRPEMPGTSMAAQLRTGELPAGRDSVLAMADPQCIMVRTPDRKYIRYNTTGGEVLYDLSERPGETMNLAHDERRAGELARMRQLALTRLLEATTPPRRPALSF